MSTINALRRVLNAVLELDAAGHFLPASVRADIEGTMAEPDPYALFLNRVVDVEHMLRAPASRLKKATAAGAPPPTFVPMGMDDMERLANFLMVPPEFGAHAAQAVPVLTYGLKSPEGELVKHTSAHPQALFDMLALVGVIAPEDIGFRQQQFLSTGWKICVVEVREKLAYSEGEAWALLANPVKPGQPLADPLPPEFPPPQLEAAGMPDPAMAAVEGRPIWHAEGKPARDFDATDDHEHRDASHDSGELPKPPAMEAQRPSTHGSGGNMDAGYGDGTRPVKDPGGKAEG